MKTCYAACKHPRSHGNKRCNRAANERQILNETRKRCSEDRNHVKAGIWTKCYEVGMSKIDNIPYRL